MINILAFGVNHKTADLKVRELFAENSESLPKRYESVMSEFEIEEALIISTCNRSEWYFITDNMAAGKQWLQQQYHLNNDDFNNHFYTYQNEQAIEHLIRVCSGLDSMILGEPHIFGQIKQAFKLAQESGSIGHRLDPLLQNVFAVTKRIRTESDIGRFPVSVASTAASLASFIFTSLKDCQILLVGAGETIERAAQYFYQEEVKAIITANRTLAKAEQIAISYAGKAISLDQIDKYLINSDIVLTATSSTLPILTHTMVNMAMKKRSRPIFLLDLAVPRNIETTVADIDGVYLYNIDDLQQVTEKNLSQRQQAAQQAENILKKAMQTEFRPSFCHFTETICAYRNKTEEIREEELQKAIKLLEKGYPAEQVLRLMSRALTNKLMHKPSVELRQARLEGQFEILSAAKRLLGINDNISESQGP